MDEDEIKAKRIAQYAIGQDLSDLSIEEVSETIEALQAEIKRLQKIKIEKNEHIVSEPFLTALFFVKNQGFSQKNWHVYCSLLILT